MRCTLAVQHDRVVWDPGIAGLSSSLCGHEGMRRKQHSAAPSGIASADPPSPVQPRDAGGRTTRAALVGVAAWPPPKARLLVGLPARDGFGGVRGARMTHRRIDAGAGRRKNGPEAKCHETDGCGPPELAARPMGGR